MLHVFGAQEDEHDFHKAGLTQDFLSTFWLMQDLPVCDVSRNSPCSITTVRSGDLVFRSA
jgi:hypothetical protein